VVESVWVKAKGGGSGKENPNSFVPLTTPALGGISQREDMQAENSEVDLPAEHL